MNTQISLVDLSNFKSVFSRSCAIAGLAFLLLIPMAGRADAQSAPVDDNLIAGYEKMKFESKTWSHSDGEPDLYSGIYSEVAYDSSTQPFTVETFLASNTHLNLALAGEPAPLDYSVLVDPSPETNQDALQDQAKDPDDWHFFLIPYLWLPALSGESTVNGNKANIGMTIADVLDAATFAAFNHFRAQKGRFFIQQGGLLTIIEDETRSNNFKIETTSTQAMLDLALGYRVLEGEVNAEDGHDIMLDLYGGARYQYMKSEIEISGIVDVDESYDWVELLVGGSLVFDITKSFRWHAVTLDFSGFGIGSASDLTTTFYSGVAYGLSDTCDLNVGYRLINIDYDRGSGSNRYSQDLLLNGPMIGVTFRF